MFTVVRESYVESPLEQARRLLENAEVAQHFAEQLSSLPHSATPLQRHVIFFDRDRDGEISLTDTYDGSRALGFGRLLSGLLALSINSVLGRATSSPPRLTLRIDIQRIHRGKHGSDTDIYDKDGHVVPERVDALFARYDRDGDGYLDLHDLWRRARGDRDLFDVIGQLVSLAEFGLVYWIAAEDGKLSKATIRGIYDGSLFYEIEARRRRAGIQTRSVRKWLGKLLARG